MFSGSLDLIQHVLFAGHGVSSPEPGAWAWGDRIRLRLGPCFQGACWGVRLSCMSQKRQKAEAVLKAEEKMLRKE